MYKEENTMVDILYAVILFLATALQIGKIQIDKACLNFKTEPRMKIFQSILPVLICMLSYRPAYVHKCEHIYIGRI